MSLTLSSLPTPSPGESPGLHAELWADHVCKVVSCWLPILMSTIVIGRDLIGSSIQCFPLQLVSVPVQPVNGTFVSDGNSTNNAFSGTSDYSRQLSEFVNVYCAGNDYVHGNTVFSYQQFAMMLFIQAALMYTPFLVWNITVGREIMCDVRFITRQLKVVYDRLEQKEKNAKGKTTSDTSAEKKKGKSRPIQAELKKIEKNWRNRHMRCIYYGIKQALSIILSVVCCGVYAGVESISVHSITEKFLCPVEDKFSVTCTVPAAPVHRYVWWANITLITFNVIVIVMLVLWLHARDNNEPFAEIGIIAKKSDTGAGTSQSDTGAGTSQSDTGAGTSQSAPNAPLLGNGEGDKKPVRFSRMNDSSLMYAFFKANIESVEMYNDVKSLLEIKQEEKKLENTQL